MPFFIARNVEFVSTRQSAYSLADIVIDEANDAFAARFRLLEVDDVPLAEGDAFGALRTRVQYTVNANDADGE